MTTQALDVVCGLSRHRYTATTVQKLIRPDLAGIGQMSYRMNVLGLLTAVPASVTGGLQFAGLVREHRVIGKLTDAGSVKEKVEVIKGVDVRVKTALIHALLNDIVIAGAVWKWLSRKGSGSDTPGWLNVLISAVTAPILGVSAFLGGKMVLDHGVGVDLGRYSRRKES